MTLTLSQAQELVEQYTEGWVHGDQEKICAPLSDACLIIESHGPTYQGLEEIRTWISQWTQASRVNSWTIRSFSFAGDVAWLEWDFECEGAGATERIYGSSCVRFKGEKISSICEYRITVLPKRWPELFE